MNSNAQTILIVEDEEPIRLILARILSDVGYATVAAQTSDEALVILG